MDERVKRLWTDALRSGQYQQGHGRLRTIEPPDQPKDCCLGVLCDLYAREVGRPVWNEDGDFFVEAEDDYGYSYVVEDVLPEEVRIWAGLDDTDPVLTKEDGREAYASEWNDGIKATSGPNRDWLRPPATFVEIADMIERSL